MARRIVASCALLSAGLLSVRPVLGDAALAVAAMLLVIAIRLPRCRGAARGAAHGLVLGALVALGAALLTDNFALRYVWIYSGESLPGYLKLANLWGGDEGTTLLLGAVLTFLANRRELRAAPRQTTACLAAAYLAVAAWMGPFAATPDAWLAQEASKGMNAHLMNPWMVLHAPLVLMAYAWTLALCAPALDALSGCVTRWPGTALRDARRAWVLMTGGIGVGMVWAFEDATYGQFWHWDPVQTAIFGAWCSLGAHLHGARSWSARLSALRWVPAWALLAAMFVVATMAVTRSDALISSHRYVGAPSWRIHVAVMLALALGGAHAWWQGRKRRQAVRTDGLPTALQVHAMRLTQLCFVALSVCSATYLALALAARALGWPRPNHLRPFFETLTNWANRGEIPMLRTAFAQWDVDGYGAAEGVAGLLAGLGFVGGWFFMRRIAPGAARVSLPLALAAGGYALAAGGPLTRGYQGKGVLSQSIVLLLPRLDVGLLAGAYLAVACASWAVIRALRAPSSAGYVIPLGVLHVGAVLALWGGLLATALNGYSQHRIGIGDRPAAGHGGYQMRVTDLAVAREADGGSAKPSPPYRATASVDLIAPNQRHVSGHALYRDSRTGLDNYGGPVRQICEILDYRYARYASVPGYVLHPFTEHGWSRDVQLWVNPAGIVSDREDRGGRREVVAVLRIFPFASLLWIGLSMMMIGGLWSSVAPRRQAGEDVG